jgi:hypothetical protein
MAIKYTDNMYPFEGPPKFTQIANVQPSGNPDFRAGLQHFGNGLLLKALLIR